MKAAIVWLTIMLGVAWGVNGRPAVGEGAPITAELIAETNTLPIGTSTGIILRLRMEHPWYTYWKNPGDSGLPTVIRWELPPKVSAAEWQWPAPERFATPPFMNYGYVGEIFAVTEITVAETVALDRPLTITAHVSWLGCNRACVPGAVSLSLVLPVTAQPSEPDPERQSLFSRARAALVPEDGAWDIVAVARAGEISVRGILPPAYADSRVADAYFFSQDPECVEHAAPQQWQQNGREYRLTMPAVAFPERLRGVLVFEYSAPGQGRGALSVDVPLRRQ